MKTFKWIEMIKMYSNNMSLKMPQIVCNFIQVHVFLNSFPYFSHKPWTQQNARWWLKGSPYPNGAYWPS